MTARLSLCKFDHAEVQGLYTAIYALSQFPRVNNACLRTLRRSGAGVSLRHSARYRCVFMLFLVLWTNENMAGVLGVAIVARPCYKHVCMTLSTDQ